MSYLEQLKLENVHHHPLPKLPKGGYDSFDSDRGWHVSEKNSDPLPMDTEPIRQIRIALTQAADLPAGCPLRQAGGGHPDGCRFEHRFFTRMVGQGVLTVGDPCPVRRACKQANSLPS